MPNEFLLLDDAKVIKTSINYLRNAAEKNEIIAFFELGKIYEEVKFFSLFITYIIYSIIILLLNF